MPPSLEAIDILSPATSVNARTFRTDPNRSVLHLSRRLVAILEKQVVARSVEDKVVVTSFIVDKLQPVGVVRKVISP